MKELNLHEEIIKSLKLIGYDRSLTLSEQSAPSDRLGPQGEFKPLTKTTPINPIQDYKKKQKKISDYKLNQDLLKSQYCGKLENEFCKSYGGTIINFINGPVCECKYGKNNYVLNDIGENIKVNEYLNELKAKEKFRRSQKLKGSKNQTDIKKITNSDRLGKYGQFQPYDKEFFMSPEEKEKRYIQVQKNMEEKWGPKLCGRAKKVCKPYGGTEVFQYENGLYACGCKGGNIQRVLDKNGNNLTVNDYFNLGQGYNDTTYTIAKFMSDPHAVLMIGSIVLSFGTFGTAVLGEKVLFGVGAAIFDFADAGLYLEEKDPFMAGLSAMFALIPFAELVKEIPALKNYTKDRLKKLLSKIVKGEKLTESEYEIVKKLSNKYLAKKASFNLFKLKLSIIIKKIKDVNIFTRFLVGLFRSGYITVKFLIKLGLIVGGVFYSWYKISEILGITQKNEFVKTSQKKLDNKTKDFTLSFLTEVVKLNTSFSVERNKNFFSLSVLLIQYCLKTGGYDVTNQEKVETTPTWEKNTPQGYTNFNYDPKYDYLYKPSGKIELERKRKEWIKSKNYILTKDFTKVKLPFKWGYFDENTKKMIENYQNEKRIPVDGIVGPKTISMFVSDLKSNEFNSIKNYSGHKLTTGEEQILFKNDLEKQKKLDEKISKEKLQKAYENQKNIFADELLKMREADQYIKSLTIEEYELITKDLKSYDENE